VEAAEVSEQDYFEQFVGDTDDAPIIPAPSDLGACYWCKGSGVEPSFYLGRAPVCQKCGGTGRMVDALPMGGPDEDETLVFPRPRVTGRKPGIRVGTVTRPPFTIYEDE
jgi:hypothetical protein